MADALSVGHHLELSLPILTEHLREVTTQWFQLGIRLKLSLTDLESIESDHRHDVKRCMTEMLALWLRHQDSTWAVLLAALDSLGFKKLAKQLLAMQSGNVSVPSLLVQDTDVFLNPSTKSAQRKVAHLGEITRDNQTLQKNYMQFLFGARKLLTEKEVSTDELVFAWSTLTKDNSSGHGLCEADTIQSFFSELQSRNPEYFDYHVLADLVEHFGGEEGTALVQSYESKLQEKLNKRIKKKVTKRACKLIVKVEWDENRGTNQQELAMKFRTTLSKLFGYGVEEFVLRSINRGCLEFTFLIPEDNDLRFQDILNENDGLLKRSRVIVITINNEVVWKSHAKTEILRPKRDNIPMPSTHKFRSVSSTNSFPKSSFRVWTKAAVLAGLLSIVCGLLLLAIGLYMKHFGSTWNQSPSGDYFIAGGMTFLLIGWLACLLAPRCKQFIRIPLILAILVFIAVIIFHLFFMT